MEKKYRLLTAMIVIIALLPSLSFAMRATTVQNSIACLSKQSVEEMVEFAASGDRDSFAAYVSMGKCLILKGGVDVTVTESPGVFGGIAGIIFQGFKFWTTRQGLTDYRASDSDKKNTSTSTQQIRKASKYPTAKEQAEEWKKVEEILKKKK